MLTVACLTLHHYSYDLTDVPTLMLCSGTYVGYVVVLSGEIVGENVACIIQRSTHCSCSMIARHAVHFPSMNILQLRSFMVVVFSDFKAL